MTTRKTVSESSVALSTKIHALIQHMTAEDIYNGLVLATLTFISVYAEDPRYVLDEFANHLKSQPIERLAEWH